MSDASSDFTGAQWQLVSELLLQRYGTSVELDAVEVDVAPAQGEPPACCPGLHWHARGAHFVVVRTATDAFRGQFFHDDDELLGPGDRVFDDLGDCVLTLLRLQADHERRRAAAAPDSVATEPSDPSGPSPRKAA